MFEGRWPTRVTELSTIKYFAQAMSNKCDFILSGVEMKSVFNLMARHCTEARW